jgi:membrane protein implicated in regulation of membrane protease activity
MPAIFWFWLSLAIVLVVVEILTLAFYAAFLALGAAGAAIGSLLGVGPAFESVAFGVVAVGGIFLGRPPLMRWLAQRREPVLRSGADSMIGQAAVLSEPIQGSDRPGHCRIAGESWPAVTADGHPLPAGTPVRVRALRRTVLVVEAEEPQAQVPGG